MQRKNLSVVTRTYKDKDGNDKKAWKTIGELVVFDDGSQIVELYHMPGVKISVFEQKERVQATNDGVENINVTKIPF